MYTVCCLKSTGNRLKSSALADTKLKAVESEVPTVVAGAAAVAVAMARYVSAKKAKRESGGANTKRELQIDW